MIWIGKDKIGSLVTDRERCATIWIGTKTGAVKIWEAISSCFGAGVWRAARPWKRTDKWKLF